MQNYFIEKTSRTPQVMLDAVKGLIDITGPCIVEDTVSFYEPVLAWVDEYIKSPRDTTINLDLEYFNSSTSRILMVFFRSLGDMLQRGGKVQVNWFYAKGDEDLKETGKDFSVLSKLTFHLVEKS